jgi:hypothetical protein
MCNTYTPNELIGHNHKGYTPISNSIWSIKKFFNMGDFSQGNDKYFPFDMESGWKTQLILSGHKKGSNFTYQTIFNSKGELSKTLFLVEGKENTTMWKEGKFKYDNEQPTEEELLKKFREQLAIFSDSFDRAFGIKHAFDLEQ